MPYTPILATLGYVMSPDGRQVLLVHRNRRPDDAHFGKYNGLGGKVDRGEDVVRCLRREVREESGLECDVLRLRGTVSWPGFGKQGEDWFGFIFVVERWHGGTGRGAGGGVREGGNGLHGRLLGAWVQAGGAGARPRRPGAAPGSSMEEPGAIGAGQFWVPAWGDNAGATTASCRKAAAVHF